MSFPQISIITPVWNGFPYLQKCIDSILNQDFKDWELLISDDCSTDGSSDYLSTLTDARIRIFKQGHNLGIFGNLNFLFTQARAPISQILCQDDYFVAPTSLATIFNYWDTALPEVGFVRFNHQGEPSNCPLIKLQKEITPAVISPPEADLWFFVFGNIPGNLSNVSLKTALVAQMNGFKQELPFAGDFEFWSRAARKVSMGIEKEQVVHVRRHANVASNFLSLNGELYLQHITIYEKLIEELSSVYKRNKLITYFNFEIGSFHCRTGVKSALGGRFAYLNQFAKTNSSILWSKWRRLATCFTFAIYERGRQKFTVKMALKLLKQQQFHLSTNSISNFSPAATIALTFIIILMRIL